MARDCHLYLSLAEEGCPLTPKPSVVTPEQGEKGLCSAQLTMKAGPCESVFLSEQAHSWQSSRGLQYMKSWPWAAPFLPGKRPAPLRWPPQQLLFTKPSRRTGSVYLKVNVNLRRENWPWIRPLELWVVFALFRILAQVVKNKSWLLIFVCLKEKNKETVKFCLLSHERASGT